MKLRTLPLVLVLAGMSTFALADQHATGEEMTGQQALGDKQASIHTSPQPAGSEISVDSVTIPDDGFVVIHASDDDGKPIAPQSIGHTAVESGTQEDVSVDLDEEVASGDKVFVMLHEDTSEKGTYEFGADTTDVDIPVMQDGKPVIVPMDIE